MRTIKIGTLLILISGFLIAGNGIDNRISELEKKLTRSKADIPVLVELGKLYHKLAASGKNKNAVSKSETYLQQALNYDENNAEAMVWLGSLTTIKGRDAWMPWNKLKFVEEGLKLMDKAVELEPQNITVRLVRANNNSSLPQFFNRADSAIVDFQFILNKFDKQQEPCLNINVPDLYLSLADVYLSIGEDTKAVEIWKLILRQYPQSESAKTAQNKLNQIEVNNG